MGERARITAGAALGRTSIREPSALPSITKSEIAAARPVDGGVDVGPGAAPTSRTSVPGPVELIPDRRGLPRPCDLRQSLASSPSFAWRPTGCNAIAPPSEPWKPSAVTASPATGSWILRLLTVASTSGPGGVPTAAARSGPSTAVVGAPVEPEPKAVRINVTRARAATIVITRQAPRPLLGAPPPLTMPGRLPGARRGHRATVADVSGSLT